MRRSTAQILVAALLTMASARAEAHDQKLGIEGNTLVLRYSAAARSGRFAFKSLAQPQILVNHDPVLEGSAVLVYGSDGGKTGMIRLEPQRWRQTATGWVYKSPDGAAGGIRRLLFRNGPGGGTLKIQAYGPNWPWRMTGAPSVVGVQFKIQQEWYCASFGGDSIRRGPGVFTARHATAPAGCESVCGNGVVDAGESCDDGNLDDRDGCASDCTPSDCTGAAYGSTWEALQDRIFNAGGCTNTLCHGSASMGGLNLEAAHAYETLVAHGSTLSALARVEPGDADTSFLYLKLAAATLQGQSPPVAGSPMPSGGLPPIPADHLEALRRWIRAGAPAEGAVVDTAALLSSCLPPASPNKLPPLDPPAANEGVQLYAPPWDLPAQSEHEVCYATYYDFSGRIPASALTPCPPRLSNPLTDTCFRYHERLLEQDPQSHHSIVQIYRGNYPVGDAGWGSWTCKGGPNAGMPCNPQVVGVPAPAGDDCGDRRSACSGAIVPAISCIDYGPPDFGFMANNAPAFGASQEAVSREVYSPGVYNVLPIKGVVVWNSHAFNLTDAATTMEQYYNLWFAGAADQAYEVEALFDSSENFIQEVPPFTAREYCRTHTFPQNTRLFHLTSHTHRFGKLFRVWGPPNQSCNAADGCLPNSGAPLYLSTQYNDPVHLLLEPPLILDSADPAQRTFKYCSRYDNGAADPNEVKRYSTSPAPPLGMGPGGPCPIAETACFGGANQGEVCAGSDALCGSGVCDACTLRGGQTTQDEMFILVGSYYVP